MTVCIDKREQVVFFTPKGRAMSDALRPVASPSFRGNAEGQTPSLDAGTPVPTRGQLTPLRLRPSGYDGSAR